MSDPKHKQREPDELDLDAETIKDLDPGEEDADGVRGGPCMHSYGSVVQPSATRRNGEASPKSSISTPRQSAISSPARKKPTTCAAVQRFSAAQASALCPASSRSRRPLVLVDRA